VLRKRAGLAVASTTALAILAMTVPSALAVVVTPTPPSVGATTGSNTQMTLTDIGPGHGVTGLIADADNPYDPATAPYPTTDPVIGFTPKDESFAGIITGTPTGTGPALKLYCIDILTNTYLGFGYQLGTWDSANVPNVGYVARTLQEYYPTTNEPASLTSAADKAAAVQAAIWYFSDRYVLSTSDPLHDAVAAIVAAVQAAGPLVQPPPPSLAIAPATLSGPAGSVLGPYTVTSSLAAATVTAIGADMFSDATATTPIANGATVPSGTKIWLKSTGPANAVLQATADATVPTGNVYLYDGNSFPDTAQKLILAETTTLTTTVTATAQFLAPGSLLVKKTIAGPAAGQQGTVTIHTVCGGTALSPDLVIPAGSAAATYSRTYTGIAAGSLCTVTETANGSTSTVVVTVTGDGQQVSVPSGSTATASLADTYDLAPGALEVDKLIAGPAAGQQGEVTIHAVCDGTPRSPDFVIPAGSPAGAYSHIFTGIPAGSSCTVTETTDGSTSTVTVTVTGSGQTVTVPAGGTATASLTDTYDFAPGSVVVSKTIAGPGAGTQGEVVLHTVCDGTALSPDLVIPAGSAAGIYSQTYTGIAAGSLCTVTETADGHVGPLTAMLTGDLQVTVPAGGTVTASLTNTYAQVPGSLVINKAIVGPAASHEGAVTISTVCDGTPLSPDFVIPAGSPAGAYSHTYDGIAAGAACTVTETADGSSSTVTATVVGSGQSVTVPSGGGATATLADSYDFVPGTLTVAKAIAGPGAGQQGQVTIHTVCDGAPLSPDLVIPAGSPAGGYSQTYTGVPGGSVCTVTETADGLPGRITVALGGDGVHVIVPPGGTATASLTDTYQLLPGVLMVRKTIAGPLAGQEGQVVVAAACTLDGATSFSGQLVIPAGSPAGTRDHFFTGIPAGSACTVTETSDGTTATVTTTVIGGVQQVTVGTAEAVPVAITDIYYDTPGSLTVIKTIAGEAAGKQGRVAILIACGPPLHIFAFLIPAGHRAGAVKRSFDGIPAGSQCLVLEVVNGATTSVAGVAEGRAQLATVPAAGSATVRVTDTYALAPIPVTG